MCRKIPTFSICNLLGVNRCASDFFASDLQGFMEVHKDLYFPHRHDFYQIVLFTGGKGKHTIDFKQYEIVPGQIYCMSPGQVHTWEFEAGISGYLLNFTDAFFAAVFQQPHYVKTFPLFHTMTCPPVQQLDAEMVKDVVAIFKSIDFEIKQSPEFQKDMLRSWLSVLLIKLSRAAQVNQKSGVSNHQMQMMQQFEQLIESHYHEKRLPNAYAEMMFISPNHLNALANSLHGISAGDMIRERVLLEVKRLLVNSDLLIGQIADRLGFDDNAYFTRFFKKYTGVTPEAFRAGYLKNHQVAGY